MPATNFTPIQLYRSSTGAAQPTAGNLQAGELAINFADGRLFYKDNAGTPAVQIIGTRFGANKTIGETIAAGLSASTGITGSGALVFATSPTFVTPTLGVASATSVNKVAITAPATSATLTLADGSTLATSGANSLTFTTTGATNLTLPTAFGTGVTTALGQNVTGSGGIVLATSPTLVTPTLGVAAATSINKVAITAPATGSTLTIADGKTLTASNSITLAGTDSKTLTVSNSIALAGTDSTTMTFPPASSNVGYLNVPINSKTADYTTVLADAGKAIVLTSGSGVTFTIAANSSVQYETGTVLTFVNTTANTLDITSTDTIYLNGTGGTATPHTVGAYSVATAIKLTSTSWFLIGNNIT